MMTCYITITYHIISYHIFFSLLSVLLICSPLYSSQLHFISNWFDSIRLNSIRLFSIELDLSYCSVLYHISMNDLCLLVCLTVYLYLSFWFFDELVLHNHIIWYLMLSLLLILSPFYTISNWFNLILFYVLSFSL